MGERLLLGSGPLLADVAHRFDRSVLVGTPDEELAETLRNGGIAVETLDPTAEDALSHLGGDIVFVIEDNPTTRRAIVRAVSRALPEAYLLVSTRGDHPPDADAVFDSTQAVASRILDCLQSENPSRLLGVLRDIDRLAVVLHDTPDPDAIASGVALARIAQLADCETDVCYYGDIGHQENRAFVNVLGLTLRKLEPDEDLSVFDGFALVDHARPGVNDQLPSDTPVDIVIDHHPPRAPIDAEFVDLRPDVGATSTLLVEYLDRFDIVPETDIATALLFGISVDTNAFTRGVSVQDFEAAASLVTVADLEILSDIETPSIGQGTFDVLARSITNRRVEGDVVLSFAGEIRDRDALSQAADRLLRLEDVTTTVVYGLESDTIYVSARSRADGIDIGEALRDAFGQVGSAGGHVDMAGAQIGIGIYETPAEGESILDIVESDIADRFLEAISTATHPVPTDDDPAEVDRRYRGRTENASQSDSSDD